MRPASASRTVRLEIVLDGELHDPGADVGLNLTERTTVQGGIGSTACDTHGTRIQEVRPILDVERFGANFEVLLFPDPEAARQGHIDVEVTWALQVVDTHVSKGAIGRIGKRRRAHPTINVLVCAVRIWQHLVGTLCANSG